MFSTTTEAPNFAKLFGIFAGVSTVYVGGLYTFCSVFRPTVKLMRYFPKLKYNLQKANKYAPLKNLQKSKNTENRIIAFGETIALKSFLSPVMLPAKLLISCELYFLMYNGKNQNDFYSNKLYKAEEPAVYSELM